MRRHIAILTAIAAMATKSVLFAADFSALAPTGQTLYFNLDGQGGAVVTYPGANKITAWRDHPSPTGVLVIPDTVEWQGQRLPVHTIGKWAFSYCEQLTSVSIPKGVKSIDSMAFYQCTALTSVTLGAGLDTIRASAFFPCANITNVVVKSPTPPYMATTAFSNTTRAQATLHVGCGLSELYAQTAPWNTFGTIDEEACAVIIDLSPNRSERGSVSGGGEYPYGTTLQLQATPTTGHFFACWSDGDTLNPRLFEATAHLQLVAHFFPLLHDTVLQEVHDTLLLYDTLLLHDTLTVSPTTHRLIVISANASQGIAAGNIVAPEGTVVEVAAIPFEGYHFSHWSDGNQQNPRQVVLTQNINLVANFDTELDATSPSVYTPHIEVAGRTLRITCPSNGVTNIYTTDGRLLHRATGNTYYTVPSAGVYLVQPMGGTAQRISIP